MIVLRPADAADAAPLQALHARTWREAYWAALPRASFEDGLYDETYWRRAIGLTRRADGADNAIVVAEEAASAAGGAGALVGFATAGLARSGDQRAAWEGEVYMLYVLERIQRQGLGAALLAAAFRHLISRGLFSAGVWCLADNQRGRAFYEAMGGQPSGSRLQTVSGATTRLVAYSWDDEAMGTLMAGLGEAG